MINTFVDRVFRKGFKGKGVLLKMNTALQLISFVIYIQATFILHAQPVYTFKNYTSRDGLVNNDMLTICQDKTGFIWIGTKNGPDRFDGLDFKNYSFQNDSVAPSNIWVNKIFNDRNGRLWFAKTGAKQTLMEYDYENDKFIDYTEKIKHLFADPKGILSLWCVYVDSRDRIWFEPNNTGAVCLNLNTWEPDSLIDRKQLSKFKGIKNILEDKDSNLWFAGTKLHFYNQRTGRFIMFSHNPGDKNSLSSNNTRCIYQDSNDHLWIGTQNGLNKLISQISDTAKFQHFFHDPLNKNSLAGNYVLDITEDRNGDLIIATLNGLSIYNSKKHIFTNFIHNNADKESINSNLIRTVYRDSYDNIWVGSNSGFSLLKKDFFNYFNYTGAANGLSHQKVEYLAQSQDSNLLIVTPESIELFNPGSKIFRVLCTVNSGPGSLIGCPLNVQPTNNNNFWAGTWNGGLSYYNSSTGNILNYIETPPFSAVKQVHSLLIDSKQRLWLNSNGEGFLVFDEQLNQIKAFSHEPGNKNSLYQNYGKCIFEDSGNRIWIGTIKGLNQLVDFEAGAFKHYLNNIEVNKVIESNKKHIWVATNNGVYNIDPINGGILHFSTQQSLPQNVSNIIQDEKNNFWITTNGICIRFSYKNDSIKDVITFQKDNIHENEFASNSSIKMFNNNIAFGGSNGFCLFDPDKVTYDTAAPKIVITSFKISGHEILPGEKLNGQVILQKSITLTNKLSLNHKNNDFSIQFTGLHFHLPQHNRYAYRLEGYEKNDTVWHLVGAGDREVFYMNLPQGEYIFKLKAANSFGFWSPGARVLKIIILPPWWLSWYFILLWFLIMILLIMIAFRLRTNSLRKQKHKLEQEVENRTLQLQEMNLILEERQEELNQQAKELMNINTNLEKKNMEIEQMAKQLHDADQYKLRFFANISHEFRTPLTLILAPADKLRTIRFDDISNINKIKSYINLIYKNALGLQRRINQIIEFRKADQGQKKLKISNNNIVEFIDEIVGLFSAMAEAKGIQLRVKSEELRAKNEEMLETEQLITQNSSFNTQFWFDPDVMEKIIYNLISNAIKYTPEGGEILIEIGIVESRLIASLQNQLAIKISDTGIGINPENLEKIFDRFYRVETHHEETPGRSSLHHNQTEGTGIGLAYTKELVQLHKGQIQVESELGKGSCFTISFLMGKEHYNKDEIIVDTSKTGLRYIHSMTDEPDIQKEINESIKAGSDNNEDLNENRPTILLVEDNLDLRKFIKSELTGNYNVIEAGNGKEGLREVVDTSPDLIISDIMMPEMDGIEFCKKVRNDENTCHIPIILLTAKEGEENILEGLQSGAGDYITKPFNTSILKAKIHNIFQLRKNLQEKFNHTIESTPADITHSAIDEKFLQKAISIVNEYMHDTEFTNEDFINHMKYSRAFVYKKLKVLTNQSLSEFIRNIRLKAAAQLFLGGNANVSEVAYQVGFKYPNDLSRYFRKLFNKSPRQFMKDGK